MQNANEIPLRLIEAVTGLVEKVVKDRNVEDVEDLQTLVRQELGLLLQDHTVLTQLGRYVVGRKKALQDANRQSVEPETLENTGLYGLEDEDSMPEKIKQLLNATLLTLVEDKSDKLWPKICRALRGEGIVEVRDLLMHFPRINKVRNISVLSIDKVEEVLRSHLLRPNKNIINW